MPLPYWRGFGGVELCDHPNLPNIIKLDQLASPVIRQMMRRGMAIDLDKLGEVEERIEREAEEKRREALGYLPPGAVDTFVAADGAEENEENNGEGPLLNLFDSAEKTSKLLYDILKIHLKADSAVKLKSTGSGNRLSTGKKQLEVLAKYHPVIKPLLEYRERRKLLTTYCRGLRKLAVFEPWSGCWVIHTEILQTRTDTGRYSSKNPNLQNIPARSELGRLVRSCFVARPGYRLLSTDYSQVELRLLAHYANERNMIGIFERGGDIHTATASLVFGVPEEEVDPLGQRLPCKNVNFMIVYGATAVGLMMQLALSGLFWDESQCQRFIDKWFEAYPGVNTYMREQFFRASKYKMVWDLFGGVRLIPEALSELSWIRSAGMRQAGNMPIQASSAGMMKLGMAELGLVQTCLREEGVEVWPLMTIHDEVLQEGEGDENTALVASLTEDIFRGTGGGLRVPIGADSKWGLAWAK